MALCMQHRFVLRLIAGLLLVGVSQPAAFAGKPTPPPPPPPVKFQVTMIGQGDDFGAFAINNAGTVVGTAGGRAYARNLDGGFFDLTSEATEPGQVWEVLKSAYFINDSGQIAGFGIRIQNGTPVTKIYRLSPDQTDADGNPINLLEPVGIGASVGSIYPWGLNDDGDLLIHYSTISQDTLPATAGPTDSAWIFAGAPGQGASSSILDSAVPHAMNNLGVVTGCIDTGAGSEAFIYSIPDHHLVTFGTITGSPTANYNFSDGLSINDSGDIGGWARVGGSNTTFQAVLRLSGASAWSDMGIPYTGQGRVNAVNNSGIPAASITGPAAVGISGGMSALGFVYLNGKAYALKDLLVGLPSGITSANINTVDPSGINDSGVICGQLSVSVGKVKGANQYSNYGVVLTPVAP